MRGIIACESSGEVRDAFTAKGFDVTSCDLLPTEKPGKHYQGDIMDIIADGWDFIVAHPPCTYICSSGLHWNKRREGRQQLTEAALHFVAAIMNAPILYKCTENPIGCISTRLFRGADGVYRVADRPETGRLEPSQIIQPYEYGHPETKATGLWLQGLPPLRPTSLAVVSLYCRKCKRTFQPENGNYVCCGVVGKIIWDNITPSGQNKLSPGPERWKERSKTYSGIAAAMADQWGAYMRAPPPAPLTLF